MAFFIRRSLSTGTIRFSVAERRADPSDEAAHLLSTGPRGEFAPRSDSGLYFDEHRNAGLVDLSGSDPEASLNLWQSLRPEGGSARSWIPAAMMVLGTLLIVFGIAVLVRKADPIGWIEIVIGALLVTGPVVAAANRLRILRERLRRERAARAREEEERRRAVGALAQRLEELAAAPSAESLAAVRRGRRPEIPYDAVAPLGRAAVISVGFLALAERRGPELVARIREAIDAVGLDQDDAREAASAIVQKVFWHLVADDRLTEQHLRSLFDLARALGVQDDDLEREARAGEEVRSLGGIGPKSLPMLESDGALKFGENCHHRTAGSILKKSVRGALRARSPFTLFVSQRRVLLDGKSQQSILYPEIFGLEVDADRGILEVTLRDRRDPLLLQVDDPIRTAQIIDLASTLPPKPKGLI